MSEVTMKKEEMQAVLKQLGVKYHPFHGEAKLYELLQSEMTTRGLTLRDGKLWKKLTLEDLKLNPGLAAEGFVEGDDVGLEKLDNKTIASDEKPPENVAGTKKTTPPPADDEEKKEQLKMKRTVRHDTVVYEQGSVVHLDKATAEMFRAKAFAE